MNEIVQITLEKARKRFAQLDEISIINQHKVISAFAKNKISLRHFNGTSGYGLDDVGRDALGEVLADIFCAEKAIVSPHIASGTHALTLALFGVLRPNDVVLSVTGEPYDTLKDVIYKNGVGSLADFGIQFDNIPLVDNDFDYSSIEKYLTNNSVKMIYIQRSRGYAWRLALSMDQIGKLCKFVRRIAPNCLIMCDNCYGEFVETAEPTQVGCDMCAGSFIKNIGGGIAPTGGYVVGRADLIDNVAGRLTSPSIGSEVGSYTGGYRLFYQGIFCAPHVVNQALKNCLLFSSALSELGYEVLPKLNDHLGDIVCSVKLNDGDKLVKFCQAVQSVSPVDAYVAPIPWAQPGYNDEVIMAAGCFVQGSSIELSCDGPMRAPYTAYIQGGLTIEHGICALEKVIERLKSNI